MVKRIILLLGVFFVPVQSQAFPCFLTLVKDNCWANYDVNVDVTNATTGQSIMSINAPHGQSWARQAFNCQPSDKLSLKANYTPTIWATDKDTSYLGGHFLMLPDAVKSGDTAWNVNVCFSADFLDVPVPPTSNGKCQCSMDKIPAIPPQ